MWGGADVCTGCQASTTPPAPTITPSTNPPILAFPTHPSAPSARFRFSSAACRRPPQNVPENVPAGE